MLCHYILRGVMVGEHPPPPPPPMTGIEQPAPHIPHLVVSPAHATAQEPSTMTDSASTRPATMHRLHSSSIGGLRDASLYPPIPKAHYVSGPLTREASASPLKSAWEVLQVDAAANAAYAARVRQAKALLSEFHRFQQSQRPPHMAPTGNTTDASAAAEESACSSHNRLDTFSATSFPPAAATRRDGQAEPSLNLPSTVSGSVEPNIYAGDGAFNTAAFEAAKHRARRLLYFNAKARTAFADHRLSLTRAVYKDLLRSSTAAPAQGSNAGHQSVVCAQSPKPTAPSAEVPSDKTAAPAAAVKEPPATASPLTAATSSASAAEAKRALNLLCGIRAMRRQTEELTMAVLHACGEWGCWTDTAAPHLFKDLFLHDGSGNIGDGEEGQSAGFAFTDATLERRVNACATLRRNLHLPESAAGDKDVQAAPDAAVAFLQLAEAPPVRRVPPPPPVSTQLALFAVQQRTVRHAEVLKSAITAAPSPQSRAITKEEREKIGAYGDIPQRLQELRGQRQGLQNILEALLQNATPAGPAKATAGATPPPPPPLLATSSPLLDTLRSSLDRPVLATPDSKMQTVSPHPVVLADTQLSSPPELVVEKTRPWVDSIVGLEVVAGDRVAAPQPSTTAPAPLPAAANSVSEVISTTSPVVNETLLPLPQIAAASAASVPTGVTLAERSGAFPSFAGSRSTIPHSSKAKAIAAAAAAAARLISSSTSSRESSLILTSGGTEDREGGELVIAASSLALQGNRRLSAAASSAKPPLVEKVERSAGEQQSTSGSENKSFARRQAPLSQQDDSTRADREVTAKEGESRVRGNTAGILRGDSTSMSGSGEEECDVRSSSSSSSAASSSYSYSTSSSGSNRSAGSGCPTPQARAASWHPHISAALSTRATGGTVPDSNERRASSRAAGSEGTDTLSEEVRRELLRWLSSQRAKGMQNAQTGDNNSDASSPPPALSPEEVRAASAWLHASGTLQRESGSCATPPMPPAVHRALQLLFQTYTPPSVPAAPSSPVEKRSEEAAGDAPQNASGLPLVEEQSAAPERVEVARGESPVRARDDEGKMSSPAAAATAATAEGAQVRGDLRLSSLEAVHETGPQPAAATFSPEAHLPPPSNRPEANSGVDTADHGRGSSLLHQQESSNGVAERTAKKGKKGDAAAPRKRSIFARLFSCGA